MPAAHSVRPPANSVMFPMPASSGPRCGSQSRRSRTPDGGGSGGSRGRSPAPRRSGRSATPPTAPAGRTSGSTAIPPPAAAGRLRRPRPPAGETARGRRSRPARRRAVRGAFGRRRFVRRQRFHAPRLRLGRRGRRETVVAADAADALSEHTIGNQHPTAAGRTSDEFRHGAPRTEPWRFRSAYCTRSRRRRRSMSPGSRTVSVYHPTSGGRVWVAPAVRAG